MIEENELMAKEKQKSNKEKKKLKKQKGYKNRQITTDEEATGAGKNKRYKKAK